MSKIGEEISKSTCYYLVEGVQSAMAISVSEKSKKLDMKTDKRRATLMECQ